MTDPGTRKEIILDDMSRRRPVFGEQSPVIISSVPSPSFHPKGWPLLAWSLPHLLIGLYLEIERVIRFETGENESEGILTPCHPHEHPS